MKLRTHTHVHRIPVAKILFRIFTGKPKGRVPQMEKLSNENYYPVAVAYVTPSGRPARVDGLPTWETSDPAIFEVRNIGADGLTAELWPTDAADGVAELTITADVDLGEGVQPLPLLVGIEARPAQAAAANFTVGAGVPKPV